MGFSIYMLISTWRASPASAPTAQQTYVQWGRSNSCSNGHPTEYNGLVMSTRWDTEQKGEFICVDPARTPHQWSHSSDEKAGRIYTVEMEQGAIWRRRSTPAPPGDRDGPPGATGVLSHSTTSAGTPSVARSAASLWQLHLEYGVEPTHSCWICALPGSH